MPIGLSTANEPAAAQTDVRAGKYLAFHSASKEIGIRVLKEGQNSAGYRQGALGSGAEQRERAGALRTPRPQRRGDGVIDE